MIKYFILFILGLFVGVLVDKIYIHFRTVGNICKLKKNINDKGDVSFGLILKSDDMRQKLKNGSYVIMKVVEKKVDE